MKTTEIKTLDEIEQYRPRPELLFYLCSKENTLGKSLCFHVQNDRHYFLASNIQADFLDVENEKRAKFYEGRFSVLVEDREYFRGHLSQLDNGKKFSPILLGDSQIISVQLDWKQSAPMPFIYGIRIGGVCYRNYPATQKDSEDDKK